jgi:hypothetical protein
MFKIFKNKIVSLLLCTSLATVSANGQSLEFGLMGGSSNYMGDLSDMIPRNSQWRPAGGILIRYNPDRYVALRASFMYGEIQGADSLSKNSSHYIRNLSFKSKLYDFNAQIEWNLGGFAFSDYSGNYNFCPYLATGINIFKINPQAFYKGQWYELQPLGTEGQGTTEFQDRRTYQLAQFAVPLVAGLKVRFNDNWNMGLEFGLRVPFTDHIDDVSSNTYVDPAILVNKYGSTIPAAELSDRSFERTPDGKPIGTDLDGNGFERGNKNTPVDFFMFGTFSLCYRFPLPWMSCTSY